MDERQLRFLLELEKKVLWLASWTIHNANHLRENDDGLKVGGHQASSASVASIMTALYFHALRPQDRVAVKPHAAPIYHAVQYLLGRQSRKKLEHFRGYKGAQSYPSRIKDTDDVDFSTGSVGLGVAQTLFASLVQDYVRSHKWGLERPEGRMIALLGDAELDEGNIFEALLEGWKQGLRNCWWIVDYNRQSLDAVVREGLWERYENLFRNFGWDVVVLKYGSLQQSAFSEPGGEVLRRWIDRCPNPLFSALVFQGGAAWRKRLSDEIGDQGPVTELIDLRSDDELARLMGNLGGHDLPAIIDAFDRIDHDRPVCFIAYTIKGFGLPFAGHKDNHSGLMTPAQMETFRAAMNIRAGHEWDAFEGLHEPEEKLRAFLDRVPFAAAVERRLHSPHVEVPEELAVTIQQSMSTQVGFGALLNEIGRNTTPFASRIVTTSPDVTVSTNLGSWVNRRKLFAREALADTFKGERIPSTFAWGFSPAGQHIELGIAEMNLFILLSALGLSHTINGERLLPIGTLYDPFIARGLDALNYACYQDARFIVVATPSGVTLAPEGGAHQSIAQPLIVMAQDGLAAFEPAFVDELAAILAFSLDYIQREGDGDANERNWLRDETGGSIYLRTLDALDRANKTSDDGGAAAGHCRWRLLATRTRSQLRRGGRLCRRSCARSNSGGGIDGGGPPRRRPVGRNVGGPAQCGLDRSLPRPRARPRARPLSYRTPFGRLAIPLRDCECARRTSGDIGVAGLRPQSQGTPARRRAFRPDRNDSRSLSTLRHRRQRRYRRRANTHPRRPDPPHESDLDNERPAASARKNRVLPCSSRNFPCNRYENSLFS